MSETFYTNVSLVGDGILYRGIKNDAPVKKVHKYRPTLFVPAMEKTEHRTLDGDYVEPFQPGYVTDCRKFVDQYKGVGNFKIYGNTDYVYQFIGDSYPDEVSYDFSKIPIAYIDIETTCENGFPDIDDPNEEIIAITLTVNEKTFVFGSKNFSLPAEDNLEVFVSDNENDLLHSFISVWEAEPPHAITGWNIKFFDIPYLVQRIERVLGPVESSKLSPWKKIREKQIERQGKKHTTFQILGVSILDYLDLYKTFTYVNQESYRLDHIAFVELGERKLSYSEFDSIKDFYKKDFQKFVEYNVKDVRLVQRLEEKLKLIELATALAYSAKVNFEDVFSQVRTWDQIIYHYLRGYNIVIPSKKEGKKEDQYVGAYVKDPIVGQHDWIVSFDLNSLCPHLIMQYNISPETKIQENKDYCITPNSILKGEIPTETKHSLAANGTRYTKEHKGFLPALMEKMYKERKMYKKKMIECQKRQQDGEDLENEIAKFNNFQMVRKIQLNSAYGAIGNQYFRYFDVDMAEAITTSGQLSIRWIADKLNEFLNKTVGTENYDYVVASDTDSVYLRLGKLVDKICPDKSKEQIVEFLDKASNDIILPFIEKQYDELAVLMNAYSNKMIMDREIIADKGIWTAKKRYMLNVLDNEGIRYKKPKLKIMGIETTRSSTPAIVREKLKKAISLIMLTDERTVQAFISTFKEEFVELDPEEVSFPRGVSNLEKYKSSSSIYSKGTPIAVKGALLYNYFIKQKNLDKKYNLIVEGDKVKFTYLKEPNPISTGKGEKVISFVNSLPKELDLHRFVDYNKQFDVAFLDPLKTILNVIGWDTEKRSTLESLFC